MSERLTGAALLKHAKDCVAKGLNLSKTAIDAGYYSVSPTGVSIPAASVYQKALISAFGIDFPVTGRGSSTSNVVNVMANNTIMLSPSRVKQANIDSGDECSIEYLPDEKAFVIKKIERTDSVKSDW